MFGLYGKLGGKRLCPAYWDFDTSLFRNLRVSGRFRLHFRSEALNDANDLVGDNTSLHDPIFGIAGR